MATWHLRKLSCAALLAPALTLALALACAGDGPGPGPRAAGEGEAQAEEEEKGGITPEQERHVGFDADYRIRIGLYKNRVMVDDPLVVGFINDLGWSIVDELSQPQPFNYRFRVLRAPSMNAFALPGGSIYFHSGTILEAHSLDELAGVMAHEIAHARRHHWARRQQASAVPNALLMLGGAALTIFTGEVAPLLIGQGAAQALGIQHTRTFEIEADEVGTALMVRAGYDPKGLAVFFERLEKFSGGGAGIPDYLRTHPRSGIRAEDAIERANRTTVPGSVDPKLRRRLPEVQARLARLVAQKRNTLLPDFPKSDQAQVRAALREAEGLLQEAGPEAAIAHLAKAEVKLPYDPRLPFRRGELLRENGRLEDAAGALVRVITLDPGRALTHFQLGKIYYEIGSHRRAVFYLEQAEGRFTQPGPLLTQTHRMLKRLHFPVVLEDAFLETTGGEEVENFSAASETRIYWARIEVAWLQDRSDMQVRWIAPDGSLAHEDKVTPYDNALFAKWEPKAAQRKRLGIWQAELWMGDERVHRSAFQVRP